MRMREIARGDPRHRAPHRLHRRRRAVRPAGKGGSTFNTTSGRDSRRNAQNERCEAAEEAAELDPRFNPDLAAEASTKAEVDVLDAIDQHIARLSSADLSLPGTQELAAAEAAPAPSPALEKTKPLTAARASGGPKLPPIPADSVGGRKRPSEAEKRRSEAAPAEAAAAEAPSEAPSG